MALPMVTETTATHSGDDVAAFERLKPQLLDLWRNLEGDPALAHTSIVVPSLSVNQEELGTGTHALPPPCRIHPASP